MDRTFVAAVVVFAALAIAGVAMTSLAAEAAARALGPALFGGSLAAFLVEAFGWDRRRARA